MTSIPHHLKREIVLGALHMAQTKATLLVIGATTQARSDTLTQLIANLSREAAELKARTRKSNVPLSSILGSSAVFERPKEIKISTVYDLATSEPKHVVYALRRENGLVRQVLRTMQYPPSSRRLPIKEQLS